MAGTGTKDSTWDVGEIIHKGIFEDELLKTAAAIMKNGMKPYHLAKSKGDLMKETDYVFITIYKGHASIVVVDKTTFHEMFGFCCDVYGQMIDGEKLQPNDDTNGPWSTARLLAAYPFRQYHVCLSDDGTRYELVYNWYYPAWFRKSRSFFIGETALNHFYRELICLTVVPRRYKLVLADCLEFAKLFAYEILRTENDIRESEIKALYKTLHVSETFPLASIEQSSRENPSSAWSVAMSYFSSFRPHRLILTTGCIVTISWLSFLFRRRQNS